MEEASMELYCPILYILERFFTDNISTGDNMPLACTIKK